MSKKINWNNPKQTLHEWERDIRAVNPKSIILDFIKCGLAPCHPTFNFIPTQEKSERGAEGVFIEVLILDPELLRTKLLERDSSPEHQKQVHWKMNRYLLFKALDDAYDELFLPQHYSDDPRRHDPEIMNSVFQLLEALRNRVERTLSLLSLQEIKTTKHALYWMFEDYKEKSELLAHIHTLRQNISQT